VLEEKRTAAMETQRDVVQAVLEQYKAEIDKLTLQMEKLQTLTAMYVAKITEYQLKVVEKLEAQVKNAEQKQEQIR
jgi:hypothetical protein